MYRLHSHQIICIPFGYSRCRSTKTKADVHARQIGSYLEALDIKHNTIVLTPPSIHCLDVAKQLNTLSLPVMPVLLTVSEKARKIATNVLIRPVCGTLSLGAQIGGYLALERQVVATSYHPWKTTQVPKLMTKLRKFPPGMTVVIVATCTQS